MRVLPTLRQMSYLIALYEERHFTKAAKACFISQSALSTSIQELENLLQVALIDRAGRKVIFTHVGEEVVKKSRQILAASEELVNLAQIFSAPLSGVVRLGVIPTIAPWLMPQALPQIYAQFSNVEIHLIELQTDKVLSELEAGNIDIGLIALPWSTKDYEYEVIGSEKMVVACGRTHKWAKKEQLESQDLVREPMILLEDGHCLKDHALAACRHSHYPEQQLQATGVATLLQMVAWQPSATLLPEIAAPFEESLHFIPLKDTPPLREIATVWRSGSVRTNDWRLLSSLFRDVMSETLILTSKQKH
ncbi:MAG: LysR substrate-binding domain-containing protein [Alphaproteobacteria bacterium]